MTSEPLPGFGEAYWAIEDPDDYVDELPPCGEPGCDCVDVDDGPYVRTLVTVEPKPEYL